MAKRTNNSQEERQAPKNLNGRQSGTELERLEPSQLEAVARISAHLITERDPSMVYQGIMEGALGVLQCDRCAVFRAAADRERVECVASRGLSAAHVEAVCRLGGKNPAADTLRELEVAWSEDVLKDARFQLIARVAEPEGFRAMLVAPMAVNGHLTGCVAMYFNEPRTFSEPERELARLFAALAAAAVENARVLQENDRQAARLSVLNEIGMAVSKVLDLDSLYGVVYAQTSRVLKADTFYIGLWDAERQVISFPYEMDRGIRRSASAVSQDEGLSSQVIRSRVPRIINDVVASSPNGNRLLGAAPDCQSTIHVPMMLGDRVLGVLSVQSYDRNAYDDEDAQMLETVAGQTAIAIENARLFAAQAAAAEENARLHMESARRAARLAVVNEIGMAVSRVFDPESLYQVVYDQLGRVLSVDAFYIVRWDPESDRLSATLTIDRGVRFPFDGTRDVGNGPCRWVLDHAQPFVLTEDTETTQRGGMLFGSPEKSRSAIHVPMLLGDRVLGVLSAQSYTPNAYNPDDVQMLQTVAGQAAVAVENARLYQAVQEAALTDELTGLPNRRSVLARLEEELSRSARYGYSLCTLMLDVDFFKSVNDTFGHSAGDSVLKELSLVLRGSMRTHDVLGRWGGEEFLVVLVHTDLAGGRVAAENLRASVERHAFLGGRLEQPLSLSLGGLAVGPSEQWDVATVLNVADTCLYQAKSGGRNQVVFREG